MKILNYTEARNNLADAMKHTLEDCDPVTITRNGVGAVVMISAEEYQSIQETLHLLSTPANSERIRRGLAEYQEGKMIQKDLCD